MSPGSNNKLDPLYAIEWHDSVVDRMVVSASACSLEFSVLRVYRWKDRVNSVISAWEVPGRLVVEQVRSIALNGTIETGGFISLGSVRASGRDVALESLVEGIRGVVIVEVFWVNGVVLRVEGKAAEVVLLGPERHVRDRRL